MPLDAICLTAVKNELIGQIRGMKIDKVQQPERDVILLSLRGQGKAYKLLVSAGAGDARIHLTEFKFDNPKTPPMFCMLLRKHISGARINEITQPPVERVLTLILETSDAMGIISIKSLIIEMIGRLSNIILLDDEGIIIDCTRRIGGELNNKRSVLPGLLYRPPPAQEDKLDPLVISDDEFYNLLKEANNTTVDKWLISKFKALSPLISREITWRAFAEPDYRLDAIKDDGAALREAFYTLIKQVRRNDYEPWMIKTNDNETFDFSYTYIQQYMNIYKTKRAESFSGMLDEHFTRSSQVRRMSQRCAETLKTMNNARNRLVRKLAVQKLELNEASEQDYYRECGDIIIANIHLLKKGLKNFTAEDFYSEDNKLREIELDPLKTPQQNAAKYYKAYNKAKNAQRFLIEQIQKGSTELVYLESAIEQIKRVDDENDLKGIRDEMSLTGYLRTQTQKKGEKTESSPHQFLSSNGMRIFVGRNNIQNDKLTLKTASRFDTWLHVQKKHGAHVIISGQGVSPDDETLCEAASIAAYYSSARTDTKVPIDYTLVKNIKKPTGGRPGMVIYNDFKTIIASPDEELVNRLRVLF